jgi:hypothetical protein
MSIIFSLGKWGGFYWHRNHTIRLCLGWVAITVMPTDIDDTLIAMYIPNKLLVDLLSNSHVEQLKDYLDIQCGFAEEEIDSWIDEALGCTGCQVKNNGWIRSRQGD